MTRTIMEQAWLDTPHRARLTSWRPRHIARFLHQIGTDYDFLFTEHSAKFVSNQWKHRPSPDWAVVTLQARLLFVRFVADRGAYEVLVSSPASYGQWFRLDDLSVLIRLYLDAAELRRVNTRIVKPPLPAFFHDRFDAFGFALSPENVGNTAQDLARLIELLSTGELSAFPESSGAGSPASHRRNSATGGSPCRKPLRVVAVLLTLMPLLSLLFFAEVFCKLRASDRTHVPKPR